MKYENILQTIGETPVIKINRLAPEHVDLYVKMESFNPMASVKDRLAFAIINDARKSGKLKEEISPKKPEGCMRRTCMQSSQLVDCDLLRSADRLRSDT